MGAQWLSGRVLDLRPRGRGFKLHRRHIVVPLSKVSNSAKIRDRYNQVPHLTKDTNGNVTNSQLDTTNESQDFVICAMFL